MDKKADKITYELKSIHVIKTMAVLEVMVIEMWLRELEKDYKTMTWLRCVPEHCIVSCIVLFAKISRQDTWNEALYMCLDYWVR